MVLARAGCWVWLRDWEGGAWAWCWLERVAGLVKGLGGWGGGIALVRVMPLVFKRAKGV